MLVCLCVCDSGVSQVIYQKRIDNHGERLWLQSNVVELFGRVKSMLEVEFEINTNRIFSATPVKENFCRLPQVPTSFAHTFNTKPASSSQHLPASTSRPAHHSEYLNTLTICKAKRTRVTQLQLRAPPPYDTTESTLQPPPSIWKVRTKLTVSPRPAQSSISSQVSPPSSVSRSGKRRSKNMARDVSFCRSTCTCGDRDPI